MAFLEWRRFTFFDIHKNVDNGKIAECLQDTNVTAATSGNSHIVLCDVTGWVHLVSRSWDKTSFKAYELTVSLVQQYQHDPYLVTIGDDEAGVNPLIKVWDWSRTDRHGNPTCVRVCRAVPSHMRPTPATALAIHDNKNLMAVGFQDGSVSLFRGDITRQRSGKMKTLNETGNSPITALAFKGADKLFIVSRAAVMVYYLQSDRCVSLEATGAPPHCSVLADKQQLMVATKSSPSHPSAIYCYTTEGRGPCYALEGDKIRLDWFRSYLVITTNEPAARHDASTSHAPPPKAHNITILDIQNKFIVFSKTFHEIQAVLTEWGSFYILTKNKELIYLDEKDLQSKLSLLFKKNLYDVAIRIASSQHYDAEGLTEIYKQYGDHLYAKGDLKGAIDQYVKTIGSLETSYVIRKYLESRHLEPLVRYLEELHSKGCATEEHTTLLLTCYVKIDQHDQAGRLREFVMAFVDKMRDLDVDVAIKVIRQVSPSDALHLATVHGRHACSLRILIEDLKDHSQALAYIADLPVDAAAACVTQHGHALMQHAPDETTDLLKRLCTGWIPSSCPLVDESSMGGDVTERERAPPEPLLQLFASHPRHLIALLEHVTAHVACSKIVSNALLEQYIHVWAKSQTDSEKAEYEQKVMKILRDPTSNYDKDQTLIICQMMGFKPGILHLYEENKLWRAQVSLHMRSDATEAALSVCRRRGGVCPRAWLDVLWHPPPATHLPELLNVIANEKLLSPILVIDCLTSTPAYTLGDVRKYLTNVLKSENDVITREQELATKYRTECSEMKAHIHRLQNEPVTCQSSRCAACSRTLELPAVHFLCQHAYHQHCFQSYSESDSECPVCAAAAPRRLDAPAQAAEAMHARLRSENDPYAVVSEYFGRGLFNKITLVESGSEPPSPAPLAGPTPTPTAPAPTYGPGAEAKLRLQEGQSKQVYMSNATKQQVPKGTAVVPVPEGRMRLIEQQQYSSSLEANISKLPEPKVHAKLSPYTSPVVARRDNSRCNAGNSPKISSAIANSNNPFEEENYDEAKNPFADDDVDPTNPFAEDDDYDKNLNPFS